MPPRPRAARAAPLEPLSENVEMYLETVYLLTERGGRARMKDIAHGWKVGPSSATEMIQRLAQAGLVDHEPYQGAVLTRKGKALARALVRKHRLLAVFLRGEVGMDPKPAEDYACEMEHVLPAEMEAWLCARLGHPASTPSGEPIPPGRCCPAG